MPTRTKIIALAVTVLAATGAANSSKAANGYNSASKPATVHSAASIECSKEADAKGLHGNERKKFRQECKVRLMAKPANSTATQPATNGAAGRAQ